MSAVQVQGLVERFGPKLTGGEVIDLFGRLRGDLDPACRDELSRLDVPARPRSIRA